MLSAFENGWELRRIFPAFLMLSNAKFLCAAFLEKRGASVGGEMP